jgi:hypothetical protein
MRTLLSLEQSPFSGMTSYYLPGINAASTALSIKLLIYTFLLRKQFYFVVSGLKFTGHGNTDNNLESHCIMALIICFQIH